MSSGAFSLYGPKLTQALEIRNNLKTVNVTLQSKSGSGLGWDTEGCRVESHPTRHGSKTHFTLVNTNSNMCVICDP